MRWPRARRTRRREQRPAPGAEVLRGEVRAEVELDVVVQPPAREVVDLALPLVAEDARSARRARAARASPPRARRRRARSSPGSRACRGRRAGCGPPRTSTWRRVSVVIPYVPDSFAYRSEPTRNQPRLISRKCDRGDALAVELVVVEMLGHRRPQVRQLLCEPDELVVLRLLLRRAIVGVVEVLLPAGLVVAGRLQLRPRARRDPDVLPRGRDRELRRPARPSPGRGSRARAGRSSETRPCALSVSTPCRSTLPSRCETTTRSSSSRATRPARSCSRRRSASSPRTSSGSSSSSRASTSRSRTGARRRTRSSTRRPPRSASTGSG